MPNRWDSSFSTVLDLSQQQEIIFATNIHLVDCMLEQDGLVAVVSEICLSDDHTVSVGARAKQKPVFSKHD
jgi:hypothetical protein